ncbi:hypothetical protein [Coxiella endosymbiont of Ornithodoros maritimus]|uniref:hypothetical protein n=1 Tax=Coxiella endosymbiont of Ornithodoros maritimus TaxID=1656172 RepID=UPI002264197A|nr:hypothetical protein [Coxiella endosymbiont of Ornithodoros maritimus]
MPENKKVACRGGKVAGNVRKDSERELGRSVVTHENHLESIEKIEKERNNE